MTVAAALSQASFRPAGFGLVNEADFGMLALGVSIASLLALAVGFAALAGYLRYQNRRTEREWLVREGRWEALLLAVLGGDADPRELWALVGDGEGLYFVDYLVRFARRTKGSAHDLLAELAEPYLAPVAARIGAGDPERRARAVETVALLGFERFEGLVVGALADSSPLVSMIAARGVARQQRPEHVALLLAHMSRLGDWTPRQLTAILTSMGSKAMPMLRDALANPANPPRLRAVAAGALRGLHDPDAMNIAVGVIGTATDRDLLAATLRLIGDLGRPGEAPQVQALCTHEDPLIRSAALEALSATGTNADHAMLRDGLDDASGWVAIQAARGLRRTGGSASLRERVHGEGNRASLARQVLLEST